MSLLLAPYNDSMRLGMGFNSYTQTCCINDAVQRVDGIKATENDLRPAKQVQAANTPSASTSDEEKIGVDLPKALQNASGSSVIETTDGQTLVSQLVTWEAKFVTKISEVTDSMNISGALAIKIDAIGGGGEASGHFIDSNKFKESDLNYHIQVKVTNQKLIADDVTQFSPIKNVQPGQFTDVYGDSFISGFLEGGIFNALISIKFTDKEALKDFGGKLKVEMDVKVAQISGEAEGGKKFEDTSKDHTTTISVGWSGGGDIKPDGIKNWTMKTLKQVAMEFPDITEKDIDRVAKCPQRTSAILTKYTALRSYYEQSLKGSPLDYENAGIYASTLLDAYMDYKSIWKQVQSATWEVDNDISRLVIRDGSADLTEYGIEVRKNYQKTLANYEAAKALTLKPNSTAIAIPSGNQSLSMPLEPNKVEVYKPTVFGLDKAKRDCRFEMIKIVQEVDAVTTDPKVAADPSRGWQYLSPVIFRQLLPTVKNMELEKNEEDLNTTKKKLQDVTLELEQKKTTIAGAKREMGQISTERDELKEKLKLAETSMDSIGKTASLKEAAQIEALKSEVEETKSAIRNMAESNTRDRESMANECLRMESRLKLAEAAIPKDLARCGTSRALEGGWIPGQGNANVEHIFRPQFAQPPRLIYGLRLLDLEKDHDWRIWPTMGEVTGSSMKWSMAIADGSKANAMDMSWLALPDNDIHFETGVFDSIHEAHVGSTGIATRIPFSRPFVGEPIVVCWFIGISKGNTGWLSIKTYPRDIADSAFTLHIESWAERRFTSARVGWLAYDSRENGKRVHAFAGDQVLRAQRTVEYDSQWYGSTHGRAPATFIAFNELDFGMGTNLRAKATIEGASKEKLQWSFGTWGDTDMDHLKVTWIGIE